MTIIATFRITRRIGRRFDYRGPSYCIVRKVNVARRSLVVNEIMIVRRKIERQMPKMRVAFMFWSNKMLR